MEINGFLLGVLMVKMSRDMKFVSGGIQITLLGIFVILYAGEMTSFFMSSLLLVLIGTLLTFIGIL